MLHLFDETGKDRVGLSLAKGEPGLLLRDEKSKPRVLLIVSKNGPMLGLVDENGNRIWSEP
jgi:hypothetical protein